MKNTLRISLKAGEKIYINGAVVRVDRKTSIEFMNDVQFLLENHVMLPENASTPLRQLYFVIQVILMNPRESQEAREMFRRTLPLLLANFRNEQILATLKHVDRLVQEDRTYEALKMIRGLYPLEATIIGAGERAEQPIETVALEALAS